MKVVTEERQEVCLVASKLVRLKICREVTHDESAQGQVVGFECSNRSSTCEPRCTYKLLLEDF